MLSRPITQIRLTLRHPPSVKIEEIEFVNKRLRRSRHLHLRFGRKQIQRRRNHFFFFIFKQYNSFDECIWDYEVLDFAPAPIHWTVEIGFASPKCNFIPVRHNKHRIFWAIKLHIVAESVIVCVDRRPPQQAWKWKMRLRAKVVRQKICFFTICPAKMISRKVNTREWLFTWLCCGHRNDSFF